MVLSVSPDPKYRVVAQDGNNGNNASEINGCDTVRDTPNRSKRNLMVDGVSALRVF
jgi:hypothetical protein